MAIIIAIIAMVIGIMAISIASMAIIIAIDYLPEWPWLWP